MLSAAHILAMDAKNLLDVIDSIRIRHPEVNNFICTGTITKPVENDIGETQHEVRPATVTLQEAPATVVRDSSSLGSLERQRKMAVASSAMSNVMIQQPIYSAATKPPLSATASAIPKSNLTSGTGSIAPSHPTDS